ncbi:hypothetical protein AV530_005437 [Patagioenas fasciata monilis]|nr:hypothetical protein AV530_005437 [Patagioenas fasciata monilis]
MQLSDLSRCAGDIFGGILSEADSLCHRNARLQRRLGALETLLARLDHRKVKIQLTPSLCLQLHTERKQQDPDLALDS